MDTCVALVQAYLHLNGYFTVVEYPMIEASGTGHARALTDIDILAVRFPAASQDVVKGAAHQHLTSTGAPDPALACPLDRPDMIVGEVKEGAARFNRAMRDPVVLAVVLARFGCCSADNATDVAHELVAHGHARTHTGHQVRMVAFGDAPDPPGASSRTIGMRHIVSYLQRYLRDHWDVLRHSQIKDPVFATLALTEKWGLASIQHTGRKQRGRRHGSL
jgi:hypothetical protein